jgi:[ribosomal protein S18]-alanine N-acetyltransferase
MPDPHRLAAVHASCFTLPRPWSASEFAALLDSPHVFVVSESNGFVMGRAVAGEAELLTIAVMPEARRQGTGGRLVDAFLTQARALGAETAFLEVAAGNAAALALYERTGFARSGLRKGYYRGPDGQTDDALVLFRAL